MDTWSITRKENEIRVHSPYSKEFVSTMKHLGGRWNKEDKEWVLPLKSEEDARIAAAEIFVDAHEKGEDDNETSLRERVDEIVKDINSLYSGDSIERIISFAYHYGRESATKEVCLKYNELISDMRNRANKSRYSGLINGVIGSRDYLPMQEFNMPVTRELGKLSTDL